MSISVLPRRNIVIPSPDGKASVRLKKDIMSTVPDWAPKTAYYKALVADGKLLIPNGRKDKAEEKARRAAGEVAKSEDAGEAPEGK